jgi:transketolase C-terminal domain/subunit
MMTSWRWTPTWRSTKSFPCHELDRFLNVGIQEANMVGMAAAWLLRTGTVYLACRVSSG